MKNPEKLQKRSAALRDNLVKRKEKAKAARTEKQEQKESIDDRNPKTDTND